MTLLEHTYVLAMEIVFKKVLKTRENVKWKTQETNSACF
jgi:hypothetical protein